MKRLIGLLIVLAAAICLPACNTTKGFGTDIGNAGDGIKHSAERNGAE